MENKKKINKIAQTIHQETFKGFSTEKPKKMQKRKTKNTLPFYCR